MEREQQKKIANNLYLVRQNCMRASIEEVIVEYVVGGGVNKHSIERFL